jgi:hypothetical protein
VPLLVTASPPGETLEEEAARLRECRRLLQAAYDRGGHITRAEVRRILDTTAPPGG